MHHPYSRDLDNLDKIEHFLKVVLKYPNSSNELCNKIKTGEAELKNYNTSSPTISSTENRHREYKDDDIRWSLRKRIVSELFSFNRIDDDDDIILGCGGALPKTEIQNKRQAFIIIGLPASGKSIVANNISDTYGAVILDSDFAKRKIPEFNDSSAGASLVHEESNDLIFGYNKNDKQDDFQTLFELCQSMGCNIVIPKIGYNHFSINNFAKGLKLFGYTVHLILISLDRRKATIRAIDRFVKSGRYVPLSLIFDCYGNDPTLTFYRLKDKVGLNSVYIDTFGKISTDVDLGLSPSIIYYQKESPVNKLFEPQITENEK